MKKVHLDTDLGGDIDDLCALGMLLHWPGVQLMGITTTAESAGRRAGYVRYVLALAGRQDVPVAAGADVSSGHYRYPELAYPAEQRYWPGPIAPAPGPVDAAVELLREHIRQGAAVVAIGPYTNLHILELQYPGILRHAELFLMGGFIHPIRAGFPAWSNEMDWNIQVDIRSAQTVLENSEPTMIPLSVTVETALRRSHLHQLRDAGDLGRLIARQAEAFALDEQYETKLAAVYPGLPPDFINFLHDPLACAVALGLQDRIEIEETRIVWVEEDGCLRERIHPSGKPIRVVTQVDGPWFSELWLSLAARSEYNG